MSKGIIYTVIYYLIGASIAGIVYAVFGQGYAHAPGPHYLVIFFTLAGGILWTIGSTYKFFIRDKSDVVRGTIVANLLVIVCFVGFIFYTINSNNDSSHNFNGTAGNMESNSHGDTTIIRYNGNIVYLRIKDSIHFNFIDSVAMNLK
jgi:hypothetical protein